MTKNQKYIISGSHDMTVRLWNFEKKTPETVFQGQNAPVTFIKSIFCDKYIVSRSDNDTIVVWNLLEGKQEIIFINHGIKNKLEVDADNKYIVYHCNNYGILGALLREKETILQFFDGDINKIKISRDNGFIIE